MHERKLGSELPSVGALAFLGDAVHTLYVRRRLVDGGTARSGDLTELSHKYVTASAQAQMLRKIEHLLLDDERDVFRRASNSTHLNKPRRASGADYRLATGFEAVLGMLYTIGDNERLYMLLDTAHEKETEENDTQS